MDAEHLVVGLAGTWPTQLEQAWLKKWRPCGVILFARNVENPTQLKQLCTTLRTLVPGLHIMADHEGGPVSQLAAALGRPPSAWTLGHVDDEDLTRRVHRRTAQLMASVGVNWVLAPCADVMTNPRNPVIGVRAFGSEEALVTRHVKAAVEGLLKGGVQVCLKHWPGHGGAGQDSHLERSVTAVDSLTEAALPFCSGLAAGARSVMVGHLCLEGEPAGLYSLPATLDAPLLAGARSTFVAAGGAPVQLIADDITMGGLREPMHELGVQVVDDSGSGMLDPEHLPSLWIEVLTKAGCDLLLLRGLPLRAYPVVPVTEVQIRPPQVVINSVPQAAEYQEARFRAGVPGEFFCAGEPILWVDLTAGDRWSEADLGAVLNQSFSVVVKVSGNEDMVDSGQLFSRVVITSHRPVCWIEKGSPTWLAHLARQGQSVVMGHPSLANDFFAILPPELRSNWEISPTFDISGWDLGSEG